MLYLWHVKIGGENMGKESSIKQFRKLSFHGMVAARWNISLFPGTEREQEESLKRNMGRDFFWGLNWQDKRGWIQTDREEV